MSQYLNFTAVHLPKKKTTVWQVSSKQGAFLGIIAWHGAWRAYVFDPTEESIFDKNCLRELADFCEAETKAFWAGKRKPKA